ncbi:MAG: fatty acid--CoA ligase family protein, partial [Candidatus Omnitrophica bacterium]|nr:fatty acid--CoA ligase family protein [Candidatus Omnitrophota bacterium]
TETNAPNTVLKMGSNKIESVGRPAPWIEIKIVDEQDQELPVGKEGEIKVRGWIVCDGYFKAPHLTAEVFRNGWFYTGDIGRFDQEGDLYIVGRKKEMIKVAGEIVFEPEVESVIMKHPEVTECAVVGVPDRLRGEVPFAFVVLKEGSRLSEEDLREFCKKYLAHFKVPHYFKFVKELPKTSSGKIHKTQIKKDIRKDELS